MRKIVFIVLMFVFHDLHSQTILTSPNPAGGWGKLYSYGTINERGSFGKALLFPTGNGPADTLWAYDLHQWAMYGDSTSGKVWFYNPKTKVWIEAGTGSGGSLANIYLKDSSLNGNRVVTGASHSLTFDGVTKFHVNANDSFHIALSSVPYLSVTSSGLKLYKITGGSSGTDSVLVINNGVIKKIAPNGFVPYTGANNTVNLGAYPLISSGNILVQSGSLFASLGHNGTTGSLDLSNAVGNGSIRASNISAGGKVFELPNFGTATTFTRIMPISVNGVFADDTGNIAIDTSHYIPYTGAASDVDLGGHSLTVSNSVNVNNISASNGVHLTASHSDGFVQSATLDNYYGLLLKYGNTDIGAGIRRYDGGNNGGELRIYSDSTINNAYITIWTKAHQVAKFDSAGRFYLNKLTNVAKSAQLYYDPSTKEVTYADTTSGGVSSPSLEDVTSVDSITSHKIITHGLTVYNYPETKSINFDVDNPSIDLNGTSSTLHLNTTNITSVKSLEFPNVSGNLAEGITDGSTTVHANSSGVVDISSFLSGAGVPTTRTISTTAPLSGGGDLSANRTLSITQATTSTNGYLSSTDWNTFNVKQAALSGTGYVKFSGTTPSYVAAIPNADLANSTISGISLGSTLASLTATDATLTFSSTYNGSIARTVGLNLSNANSWAAGSKQTFQASASTAGLNLAGVSSDPSSLSNGDIWHNTTSFNLKYRANGTTRTIANLDEAQTLTNKTIAAGSNTITGLTNSNLSGSAGITVANLSYAANSIAANATGSTAAPTAATWFDSGVLPYSGTISNWVGTTRPTGTADSSYRWTQIGKNVSFYFWAKWATNGSAITAVDFTLPSDLPLPSEPSTFNATSDIMYQGAANMANTQAVANNGQGKIVLIKTGTGTYKFNVTTGSTTARNIQAQINYIAQ